MSRVTKPSRWSVIAWTLMSMVNVLCQADTAPSPADEHQLVIEDATIALTEQHAPWGQINGGREEVPYLRLSMKPLFEYPAKAADAYAEPIAIRITVALTGIKGRFDSSTPFLSLPLKQGATPTARYDNDINPLSAYDDRGNPLRLTYRDEDPVQGPRLWYLVDGERSSDDLTSISVEFTASYRKTDEKTQAGPRIDLRRDVSGGGLVGKGTGFIPVPPPPGRKGVEQYTEGDEGWDEMWNITVEWDLSEAPDGIHGAWSLGDAETVNTVDSLDRAISNAVFAVGYLRRFPDWDTDSMPTSSTVGGNAFAVYWLEPSPYDMVDLARTTRGIYSRIAEYFDNSTDPFRVFIRRIEANFGGTGATASFLLEYSLGSVEQADQHNVADLLAHETVHEFALLDADPPGRREPGWLEDEGAWYDEGVASYLGALVGLDDPEKREWVSRSLNGYAQAYYTSPVVDMAYGDVLTNYWESMDITRVTYDRGVMYLVQLNGLIEQATEGHRSLDDLILGLYRLRRDGKPASLDTLRDMAADLIGREAFEQSYAAMFRGDLIVPSTDCLGRYDLRLLQKEWPRFELGFDSNSMRVFKVQGLVIGSNADKAGVFEGDTIVKGYMVWGVADELGNLMKMTVLRDEKEVELEWWPRSEQIVEAYGWVDMSSDQTLDEL